MKEIGFVGGFWSTNIGNSFFNLGADFLLRKLFPHDTIRMISDQPGYWTFWNKKNGNPANALDVIGSYSLDYLVLLGPCLTETFGALWQGSLERLLERGTKLIILSAGQMKYTDKETETARKILQKFKPYILCTRDRKTFANFSDCAEHSYDGIDLACFISDLHKPNKLNLGEYIVLNFDKLSEPELIETDSSESKQIILRSKGYKVQFPAIRTWLGEQSDTFRYLESFLPISKKNKTVDGLGIIRTNNRYNPMILKRVYCEKNSFASDIPYSYFDLLGNAEVTISDRVHSCVASLVYGKQAMLCKKTGRSGLLERIGAKEIQNKAVQVDLTSLQEEKEKLISHLLEWLK